MIKYGNRLFGKRQEFIEEFISLFVKYYNYISSKNENISNKYKSCLVSWDFKLAIITPFPSNILEFR